MAPIGYVLREQMRELRKREGSLQGWHIGVVFAVGLSL